MQTKHKYLIVALIILLAALVLLVVSFTRDARRLRTNGVFNYPTSGMRFRMSTRSATISDVGSIATWMTFGYINKSFNIPDSYIKETLDVSDHSYPNVTISRVAKEKGALPNDYLEVVKNAVSARLATSTVPN